MLCMSWLSLRAQDSILCCLAEYADIDLILAPQDVRPWSNTRPGASRQGGRCDLAATLREDALSTGDTVTFRRYFHPCTCSEIFCHSLVLVHREIAVAVLRQHWCGSRGLII